MKSQRNCVVLVLCLATALPTEAFLGGLGKAFENIGKGIAKGATELGKGVVSVGKEIAKPLCNAAVGVVCPGMAAVGATATIAATGGSAAPLAVAGAAGLLTACGIAKVTNQCDKVRRKREIPEGWTWYPISGDFDEYDDNGDGFIEYEEFAFDFLARFKLANPIELRGIFKEADTDGDGMLDRKEFFSAPWDFGTYPVPVKKTPVAGPPPPKSLPQ